MGRCKGLVLFIGLLLSSASFARLSKEQANDLLHDGAWKGYINRMREALAAGADINSKSINHQGKWSALNLAALGGHTDAVKFLIKNGAIVYRPHLIGATALHWAAFEVSSFDKVTPVLLRAVKKQALRLGVNPIKAMAEYINTPAYDYETALHWASKRGDLGSLNLLLKHPQTNIQIQDHQGQTALHHAIEAGQIKALRLLLESGVDANLSDTDGRTPLHYCAHRGWKVFIKALIKRGVDLNKQNKKGQTALHEAAILGHKKAYSLLLKLGADPELRDLQGKTATDYIKSSKLLIKKMKVLAKKHES